MEQTFTLTFGDCAENHNGMQIIGKMADDGFNLKDLTDAKIYFENKGCSCEIIHLNALLSPSFKDKATDAYILIIRKGADVIVSADQLFKEQELLEKDKKALMRGVVKNKNARYNLCFDDTEQKADYINGKGTIVAFKTLPVLNKMREEFANIMSSGKASDLLAEGNYYYDLNKTYCNAHGDFERKRVIAVRLGATMQLHYQWFQNCEPLGKRLEVNLNHGDIYIMSEKAVGTDWKKRNPLTLRHAAGRFNVLKKNKCKMTDDMITSKDIVPK